MQRFLNVFIPVLFVVVFIFTGCKSDVYSPTRYIQGEEMDSLMVKIVTLVGRKPKRADHITRHNAEFRPHYEKHAKEFTLQYYFIDKDQSHFFYLIRPAKSMEGNNRGVGGKFRVDENGRLIEFEEFFNTRVMGLGELKELGQDLFKTMVEEGNANSFIKDRKIVEWPDDRCVYDKEMNDWVYLD